MHATSIHDNSCTIWHQQHSLNTSFQWSQEGLQWQHRHSPQWQRLQCLLHEENLVRNQQVKRNAIEQPDYDEAVPRSKRQRVNTEDVERLMQACQLQESPCSNEENIATSRKSNEKLGNNKTCFSLIHNDQKQVNQIYITEIKCEDSSNEVNDEKRYGKKILEENIKEENNDNFIVREELELKFYEKDKRKENDDESSTSALNQSSTANKKFHCIKRGADYNHQQQRDRDKSDEDDTELPCVKRIRKLKRGLRLCSNITCYIEQVLYNC